MNAKKAKALRKMIKMAHGDQKEASPDIPTQYLQHKTTNQIIVKPTSFRGLYRETKRMEKQIGLL